MNRRILITGASGFIGSNLMTLLRDIPDVTLFEGTRDAIDLYSKKSVKEHKENNKINTIIHCAISGNGRTTDTADDFYKNMLMFENLHTTYYGYPFINIGSGAEYDRKRNIAKEFEGSFLTQVPTDYYGLAKNIIAKTLWLHPHALNLRLFGCFYHNELPRRMIRSCIENYINHTPIIISEDKHMDFFYMEDLATIIKSHIQNPISQKDLNLSYEDSPRLSDIANIVNNLSDYKVEIIIENEYRRRNYSGYGKRLEELNLPLKGMEQGIQECYEKLKIVWHK